jgi:hypothetical protein
MNCAEVAFMKRLSILVILALVALLVASCGGGGDNVVAGDIQSVDNGPDFGPLPDVPTHVFDLVVDVPQDIAGDTQEKDLPEPDGDVDPGQSDGDTDEPPKEVTPDQGCIPACILQEGEHDDYPAGTEKQCGEDGCDSICGYCNYDEICVKGMCEDYCKPLCEGKQCGFDGCYGDCPPGCDPDFVCGDDGLCYPDCDVEKKCAGKECGSDGCGGECGYCGIGYLCNEDNGLCDESPCGLIDPATGDCGEDNVLLECIDDQLVETVCGAIGEDFYCQWDAPAQKYICKEGCVPQCKWDDGTPKECGYDGCYGECGICPQGWECQAGTCYPLEGGECGWITANGTCIDNKLWFCSNNNLQIDDCPAIGKNCIFDSNFMKFKCL